MEPTKALDPKALDAALNIHRRLTSRTFRPALEAAIRAYLSALSRTPEAVEWQYRVMFDKGSKRGNEWCGWHLTTQEHFGVLNAQIADGRERIQTRALYATPPAPQPAPSLGLGEWINEIADRVEEARSAPQPALALIEENDRLRTLLKEARRFYPKHDHDPRVNLIGAEIDAALASAKAFKEGA